MADRKKQHYVPQFYLRNFSDADRARVGLYNIGGDFIASGAAIRNQSYRNYYYGKDGKVKSLLGLIEAKASQIIGEIIRTGRPPRRYSEDHIMLLQFIVLQDSRTVHAAAHLDEMAGKLAKSVLRRSIKDQELLSHLDDVEITLTDPVSEAIRPALISAPHIYDLKPKLLSNESNCPFITSDHPVVRHNDLFISSQSWRFRGLANLGLEILLPISPKYAILLYDETTYNIGTRTSNVVRVASERHIENINRFQWLGAHENVYFHPDTNTVMLREHAAKVVNERKPEQVEIWEKIVAEESGSGVLINVSSQPASGNLKIPLIRTTRVVPPLADEAHVPVRNPDWATYLRSLTAALDAGRITTDEFLQGVAADFR